MQKADCKTQNGDTPGLAFLALCIFQFAICVRLAPFYEPGEVGDDPETDLLAFLRVKLAGKEAIGRDAGDKRRPVVGRRGDDGGLLGHHVIGVDEIDVIAVADPF